METNKKKSSQCPKCGGMGITCGRCITCGWESDACILRTKFRQERDSLNKEANGLVDRLYAASERGEKDDPKIIRHLNRICARLKDWEK